MVLRMSPGRGSEEREDRERSNRKRHPAFASYLSAEEKRALRELERDPSRRRLPTRQALRLLALGLAELSRGHLVLTRSGRDALALVREPLAGSER